MSKTKTLDIQSILITSLIAIIPYTIINQLFAFIERKVNSGPREMMTGYFARIQPDYYPLLFMAILFIAVFFLVTVYSMIYEKLPSLWVIRGILIGLFIFGVADLPYSVYTAYTTVMPTSVARGIALFGLLANLVNGLIIAYVHKRVFGLEVSD